MKAQWWDDIENGYGIEIERYWQVRGAFRLDSDRGPLFLKRSRLTEKELRFVTAALAHLDRRGFDRTPRVIATTDGAPFLCAGGARYVLTEWRTGEECDFDNRADTQETAGLIAELHQASAGFDPPPGCLRWQYGTWPQTFRRRLAELALFGRIAGIRAETHEFDREFLRRLAEQTAYGQEAYAWLQESRYPGLVFLARRERGFCHHDLAHHNVIREPDGRLTLVDFDYAICDLRVHDLANLLRRVLKRNGWQPGQAWEIVAAYDRRKTLLPAELELLAVLLWWPQEYWQVAFQYYFEHLPWPQERFIEALRKKSSRPESQRAFVEELRKEARSPTLHGGARR